MDIKKNTVKLIAGAATTDITPNNPQFLYGYPFVERYSTGTHDPLLSSAMFVANNSTRLLFISNDIIFISKELTKRIRNRINVKTGIPEGHIMVGATHTHSGPVTVNCTISSKDPGVPEVDREYLSYLEEGIVEAGCNAYKNVRPAEIGFINADGTGIGTNRHNPDGPSDMDIPVLLLKDLDTKDYLACMAVISMHPTVLHEDSRLYSGDFFSHAREILQKKYLGNDCPVLNFIGAAGNQSPRHVTKANTFDEAERLGNIIATSVGAKINRGINFISDINLGCLQKEVGLPKRHFPPIALAKKHLENSERKMKKLKDSANRQAFRSAEVDWFGAVELFHLSELSESNALDEVYKSCLPAEIQAMKIGFWNFVFWPGEIFVEYGLELKSILKNTFLITLANGELQGYIATKEAVDNGYYEASNAIFDYKSGQILVEETLRLFQDDK